MRMPYFLRASQPNCNLKAAETALKGVKYILIDELSLVGKFMLGMVSERLKAVFKNDLPFGGVSVIALGDFSQSRPVADQTIYSNNSEDTGIEKAGGVAYRSFNQAIFLDEMVRQGPTESEFRETLMRIRKGELTEVDKKLLDSRVAQNIPDEELQQFVDDGTALYAEHADCDKYNQFRLEGLGTKIVDIPAVDSRAKPQQTPTQVLRVAVGAKVFLNVNLWTESGLYNGALGEVTEIGEPAPGKTTPQYIFVKFDKYHGPKFLLRDDIPLVMVDNTEFTANGESYTRRQFPLSLAFAITVHKAQGCTMKKVIIGIPSGYNSLFLRFAPELAYVALSRVRKATDFVLTSSFRSDMVRVSAHLAEWLAEEERIREMEP